MTDKYSLIEKLLHYIALQPKNNAQMLFNIERSIYSKDVEKPIDGKHAFISGLARSGTTSLMRAIYSSNQFASLTYRNMPFVLCPNLWGIAADIFPRRSRLEERSHGDGIFVDANSPEEFDEVFWRVFSGDNYIKKSSLVPYNPDLELLNLFADYIGLILYRNKKSRYLSKNNNNILRLSAIKSLFPDAIILIPIRDPVSHSMSLLAQHKRFSHVSEFTRMYMTWLGHHEFGVTHKPFVFDSKAKYQTGTDTENFNYWLEVWYSCYDYLSRKYCNEEKGFYFVPYENLCTNPNIWHRLTEILEIDSRIDGGFRLSQESKEIGSNSMEIQKANELYQKIKTHALEKLGE